MAVEKIIELTTKLDDTGIDELNKKLGVANVEVDELQSGLSGTSTNLDNTTKAANKTASSITNVTKNGGAIAVLDRLTGGLASQFRDALEASTLFNGSLKGMRTALVATGIGAFIVALGVVVAYWEEIEGYILGSNKLLERQIGFIDDNLELLDFELKLLDAKEKVLEAEGKSTAEIKAQKEKILLIQQEENLLLIDKLRTQLEIETAQVKEITFWEKVKIKTLEAFNAYELAAKARAEAVVGDEDERNNLAEIEKRLQESQIRAEQLKLSLIQINQAPKGKSGDVTEKRVDGLEGVNALQEIGAAEIEVLKEITDEKLRITSEGIRKQLDAELIAAEQRKDLERAVANAKLDITQNTLSLVRAIVDEDSKVGKGLAVAQATISGIEGVQNAYTSAQKSPITSLFPAYPVIQAGLAGAFSALQIKKILSTDPTGRSTPNLGGGGGGGAAAPSFNVVGTSGVNQLAQSLQQDSEPIEAFVVATNVSSAQSLNRNIVETSTIG